MKGPSTFATLAAAALAVTAGGLEGPRDPLFSPAEAIVRFRNNSEPALFVAAWAKGEVAAQGRLDTYLAALSEELGIPARAKRVASGGDVILAIDMDALNTRLTSHLRGHPRVVGAVPTNPPGEVTVELAKGSREAQAVEEARLKKPEGVVAAPPVVARELARGFAFDVTGRITPRGLLVTVDPRAVTLKLVERLRQRPDVEYAQPNFVMKLGVR